VVKAISALRDHHLDVRALQDYYCKS